MEHPTNSRALHETAASAHDIAALQRLAEGFMQTGDFAAATVTLSDALALAPENREIQLSLYRSARLRQQPAAALAYLAKLRARFPNEIPLALDQAETLLDIPNVTAAETICLRLLANDPANRRALIALVQAARIRRDDALLLERLNAAFAVLPPDADLLNERGALHLAHARHDLAELDFRAALTLAPQDARARLGLFHAGRGRVSPREEFDRIAAVLEVSAPEPALLLDRAEAKLRLGDAAGAEADAASVLANHPADTRALLVKIHAARLRGDAQHILQAIDAARALAPNDPRLGAEREPDRAMALMALGRVTEAQTLLNTLAKQDPNNIDTQMLLGRLARTRGERAAALSHFQHALTIAPENTEAMIEACAELTALARYDEADALAKRLAKTPGFTVASYLCRGFNARQQGDRSAALAWFRKVMKADPTHDDAALNAAAEWAELGDLARAEATARIVLHRARPADPATTVQALLRLAHIAQCGPDRTPALAYLREAAALAPGDAEVLAQLSAECREQGLFDESAAALERLAALRPHALPTLLARGHLARRRADRAAALEHFTRAHQAFPLAATPLSEMALEQRALNQPEAAEQNLQRALALEPEHIEATMRLAEQHFLAGRAEECIARCAALRARLPKLAPIWLMESRALAEHAGSEAALALLDQAGAVVGAHPSLLALRIDLLRDIGDYPAIRALLTDVSPGARPLPNLWGSVIRALLRFAETDELQTWFSHAPAGSIAVQAEAEELRGTFAETCWQQTQALAHYRQSMRLDPTRHLVEQDIARVCLAGLEVADAQAALHRYTLLSAGDRTLRGESMKPTQTHVGQLLDEYRLDAETVSTLAPLRAVPAATRLAPIRRCVNQRPDSTVAASFLLLSLREAGLLGHDDMGPPGDITIPRRITQYWFQPEPPPDVAALMQSWPQQNPDYVYRRFDDAQAQTWLQHNHVPAVSAAYQRAPQKAQKADLFRLAVLSVEGGIYADADDRCLAPFDRLLTGAGDFIAYQEDYGTLGNNILAATPRHPVILRALTLAVAAINRGDADLLWLATGPGLISRAFAQIISSEADGGQHILSTSRILDRRRLGRVMAMHCQLAYKATEQHWLQNLMKETPAAKHS